MKRVKILVIVFVCFLLAGTAVFAFTYSKRPYKDLEVSEITSATVRLIPPDKTIQITEIEELAEYLKDVVIYRRDDSYVEYTGQGVSFTLKMSDGTQTEITAYNPFLIIDGVGYRTKYEPCEALNSYANELLRDEDARIVLEKPPVLDVISDNTCNSTLLGAYSWQSKNDDGTITTIEADSAHPLDCEGLMDEFETADTTAVLRFKEDPDHILSVCCWSDAYWSDPEAEGEDLDVNGNEIELKSGGYIYEVTAEWDTGKSGYGGTAHYSFYIKVLE